VTNTTFYLHSMGRKNSSVNNELKQYLTCKAIVLYLDHMQKTLLRTVWCTITQHQKQHSLYINIGNFFQPYMEM